MISSGGFRGVSLVSVEIPFSVARVCAAIADRAPSFSRTSRTEALTAAPFQASISIEIDPEVITIAITSRLH